MKILVLLYIANHMLTVTPSLHISNSNKVLTLFPSESTLLLAHSNLAGTIFYDLRQGELVTAIYNDHTAQTYTVDQIGAYAARNSSDAISSADFMMRVDNSWRMMTDVLGDFQSPNSITLMTCYASSKGFDVITGRLFIELAPMEQPHVE